jgi:hypothetical protein
VSLENVSFKYSHDLTLGVKKSQHTIPHETAYLKFWSGAEFPRKKRGLLSGAGLRTTARQLSGQIEEFGAKIDLLSKVTHDFPVVAAQQEPPRVRPQRPIAEVIYQIIFMPN